MAWPIILTGIRVATQLAIGIAAIGAFAAGRLPRKSDIGCDEEAAEKAPLLARDYASVNIPVTA